MINTLDVIQTFIKMSQTTNNPKVVILFSGKRKSGKGI